MEGLSSAELEGLGRERGKAREEQGSSWCKDRETLYSNPLAPKAIFRRRQKRIAAQSRDTLYNQTVKYGKLLTGVFVTRTNT